MTVWKRRLFWLFATAAVGGLVLLAFCQSHRVWSLNEQRVYRAMDRGFHPAWRDYHFDRIQAGDPVEEVIARTRPVRVERAGRWVILKYHGGGLCFAGLTAAAYDGQMVGAYAWSDFWVRQFFDIMSEEQRKEFVQEYFDQPARVGHAFFVR